MTKILNAQWNIDSATSSSEEWLGKQSLLGCLYLQKLNWVRKNFPPTIKLDAALIPLQSRQLKSSKHFLSCKTAWINQTVPTEYWANYQNYRRKEINRNLQFKYFQNFQFLCNNISGSGLLAGATNIAWFMRGFKTFYPFSLQCFMRIQIQYIFYPSFGHCPWNTPMSKSMLTIFNVRGCKLKS